MFDTDILLTMTPHVIGYMDVTARFRATTLPYTAKKLKVKVNVALYSALS